MSGPGVSAGVSATQFQLISVNKHQHLSTDTKRSVAEIPTTQTQLRQSLVNFFKV